MNWIRRGFLLNKFIIYRSYFTQTTISNKKFLTSTKKMSEYIVSENTPIHKLDCEEAFHLLAEREKLYAHYLSRSSHLGSHICLFQTSVESPLIYTLLQRVFQVQSIEQLKTVAIQECNFTEHEFIAFTVYVSSFIVYMSNYNSFGDKKFIPNLSEEKFEKLIRASKYAKQNPEKTQKLLANCLKKIFSLEDKECQLGYPDIGTTAYFSSNVTKEDNANVMTFLKNKGITATNTRLFKTINGDGKICYEIRLASVLNTDDQEASEQILVENTDSHKYLVTRGDYSPLLKLVNQQLQVAKDYAANENEVQMIDKYIQSFYSGSVDAHKDGSRFWVKNIDPIIETYIGFIETYQDPGGVRGAFEGFVAMVNKPMSLKYANLVKSSEKILQLLPWPAEYEKDKFLKPDYTSLEILTFAPQNPPVGINIPNYDEIRQNEGFKNVTLANVMLGASLEPLNFLTESDQELHTKYSLQSKLVFVGLHELLGHGSGKLFNKRKDGSFNFNHEEVKHLETHENISSWYEDGDTYESVFGSLHNPYEECRADCVALYLSNVPEVLDIFGCAENGDDVVYIMWLFKALCGLIGLRYYEPKAGKWMQAHMRGSVVILRVLLESEDPVVRIEKIVDKDGNPNLLLTLDRTKIDTVAKPCIGRFLRRLQLYKTTADIDSATKMFDHYSNIIDDEKFLEYRDIVIARKKPRLIVLAPNTLVEGNKVILKNYDKSFNGIIESWIKRFQDDDLDDILEGLWEKDKAHF